MTLFVLFVALFCLKIVWNFSVPYILVARAARGNVESGGISFHPWIEVVIFLFVLLLSFVVREAPLEPKRVAICGGGLIIGSYVHFVTAGMIIGWVGRMIRK